LLHGPGVGNIGSMSAPSKIREIRVTNTLNGKKEVLQTLVPGKLTMYSCGPTVYNLIHIGNLRAAMTSDLFFRYFKRVGYEVNYVRNYTDVDDKIIQKANDEKTTADAITTKYIHEVEKDYHAAGLQEPTHKTRVTDHMSEIIQMIEQIIQNGKGYVAADGEVLFSIGAFKDYGKLSRKDLDELIAGARVEISEKKKHPFDFTLWKPAKPGEPFWDSPWGKGRPGWHIECSAMSTKWLGPRFDVHHGGEDLIFPHHENEIAQSEAATNEKPFCRYWLHNSFLTLSKEKMSKSIGNVFLVRDFLTKFSGEFARFLLLSVHYRSLIDFGPESVDQTLTSLNRLYEAKLKAQELTKIGRARADLRAEGAWGEFVAACEATRKEIDDHYANDFNTPGALAALFSLIREFNRTAAEPLAAATPSAVLGAEELIKIMEDDIGSVIGIGRQDPTFALDDLKRITLTVRGGAEGKPTEAEILVAIQGRADARKAKDFAKADQIRKNLEARGVRIKDNPTGTSWEYI
jgi:cysteinyl-tRNA synthetase